MSMPKLTRRRIIIISGVIAATVVIAGISLFWGPFFLNEYDEKAIEAHPF